MWKKLFQQEVLLSFHHFSVGKKVMRPQNYQTQQKERTPKNNEKQQDVIPHLITKMP